MGPVRPYILGHCPNGQSAPVLGVLFNLYYFSCLATNCLVSDYHMATIELHVGSGHRTFAV